MHIYISLRYIYIYEYILMNIMLDVKHNITLKEAFTNKVNIGFAFIIKACRLAQAGMETGPASLPCPASFSGKEVTITRVLAPHSRLARSSRCQHPGTEETRGSECLGRGWGKVGCQGQRDPRSDLQ